MIIHHGYVHITNWTDSIQIFCSNVRHLIISGQCGHITSDLLLYCDIIRFFPGRFNVKIGLFRSGVNMSNQIFCSNVTQIWLFQCSVDIPIWSFRTRWASLSFVVVDWIRKPYCQKYPLNCLAFGDVRLGWSCSAMETHSIKVFTYCSWADLKPH